MNYCNNVRFELCIHLFQGSQYCLLATLAVLALAFSALHNKIKKAPKKVVHAKRSNKDWPSPNVCSTCTFTDYTWRHRLTLNVRGARHLNVSGKVGILSTQLYLSKSWIFCPNQGMVEVMLTRSQSQERIMALNGAKSNPALSFEENGCFFGFTPILGAFGAFAGAQGSILFFDAKLTGLFSNIHISILI